MTDGVNDKVADETQKAFRAGVTLEKFNLDPDPDAVYEMPNIGVRNAYKTQLHDAKSEKQISDMWEYNLITGKCRLPAGIK